MLSSHAPDDRVSNLLSPVCGMTPVPFPSPPQCGTRDRAAFPVWQAAPCSWSRAEYGRSDIHRPRPVDAFPLVQHPLWRGNSDIVPVDLLVRRKSYPMDRYDSFRTHRRPPGHVLKQLGALANRMNARNGTESNRLWRPDSWSALSGIMYRMLNGNQHKAHFGPS
jgi:hypothetical protein